MRRLLFALALAALWAGPSQAQTLPNIYSVATPAHIFNFNPSTSVTITSGIVARAIQAICTVACFIQINASGQTFPLSKVTGIYLPADLPQQFAVTPGSKVRVIGDVTNGNLHVIELTR